MISRRSVLLLAGLSWWNLATFAQRSRVYRLGVMINTSADASEPIRRMVESMLSRQGFHAGRNLELSYVYSGDSAANTGGREELIAAAARQLVALKPDAIYVDTTPRVAAVKALTTSIPIVFSVGADPVASGLVETLARPGGNATGAARFTEETIMKRVELVRELLPSARRFAIVGNYRTWRMPGFPDEFEAGARMLGLEHLRADISAHGDDLEATLRALLPRAPQALITVFPFFGPAGRDPFEVLSQFERAHGIPVIYEFPGAGAVALGAHWEQSKEEAMKIVAQVLRGANPAHIPVHRATRILLTVNLAKAREMRLKIPPSVLARADQVISP